MMRVAVIFFTIFINLYGTSDCHKILKEIKILEDEKKLNVASSVATVFLGKGYTFGEPNNKLNKKIKLLKYQLKDCQYNELQ